MDWARLWQQVSDGAEVLCADLAAAWVGDGEPMGWLARRLGGILELGDSDVHALLGGVWGAHLPFVVSETALLSRAQRTAISHTWALTSGVRERGPDAPPKPLHLLALGPHSVIQAWDLPVMVVPCVPQQRTDIRDVIDAVLPGLTYITEYISPEAERALLSGVAECGWHESNKGDRMSRRIHHFGYPYKYPADGIDTARRLGDLPGWCHGVIRDMLEDGHVPHSPDQLTVNEYLPGQGIAPHVDSVDTIDEHIAVISLGSSCVMNYTDCLSQRRHPLLVQPRSLMVISGDARYKFTHHIAKRKGDSILCTQTPHCPGLAPGGVPRCTAAAGHLIPRGRRVSLTFRKIIPQPQ